MVERWLPKPITGVRFPSPAFAIHNFHLSAKHWFPCGSPHSSQGLLHFRLSAFPSVFVRRNPPFSLVVGQGLGQGKFAVHWSPWRPRLSSPSRGPSGSAILGRRRSNRRTVNACSGLSWHTSCAGPSPDVHAATSSFADHCYERMTQCMEVSVSAFGIAKGQEVGLLGFRSLARIPKRLQPFLAGFVQVAANHRRGV